MLKNVLKHKWQGRTKQVKLSQDKDVRHKKWKYIRINKNQSWLGGVEHSCLLLVVWLPAPGLQSKGKLVSEVCSDNGTFPLIICQHFPVFRKQLRFTLAWPCRDLNRHAHVKDFSLHQAINGRYFSTVSLVVITFQVDLFTKIWVFNLSRCAMILFVLQRSILTQKLKSMY